MASLKDQVRAEIFADKNRVPKTENLLFFGQEIELRQPSVQVMLSAQMSEDRALASMEVLARYAYVPGTDELVFGPEDIELLLSMPFGNDFVRISEAVTRLTGIQLAEKKAGEDSSGTQSSTT
jgi:hypothetical protein